MKTAVLLGAGGLGCPAALALAEEKLDLRLVIVDADRVERSNLARQILYGDGDLGRPKAEVAAQRVGGEPRVVRFEAATAGDLLQDADVLLVGAVEEHIGVLEQISGSRGLEPDDARLASHALRGDLRFRAAEIAVPVEDLAGEVRALDAIGVDDHQSQVELLLGQRERRGAAEPTRTEQHGGLHGGASSENSRSPGAVTMATPPRSCAYPAAAAPA